MIQTIDELRTKHTELVAKLTIEEKDEYRNMIDEHLDLNMQEAAMRTLMASSQNGEQIVETFLKLQLLYRLERLTNMD